MLNQIEYLKNYYDKQILKIEKNTNLKSFLEKEKKLKQSSVYESEELKIGDYILVNNTNYKIHIVKPNETLQSIANKYNIEADYIRKINKINRIFIGQQLLI